MKKGKSLVDEVVQELEHSLTTSPTQAGQTDSSTSGNQTSDPDRVDAINQVFALFRLNFHNQYYKAFGDTEQLNQIKKLWLDTLLHFAPDIQLRAARTCIEDSEYLPTLHTFISACNSHQHQKLGLPPVRDAYLEACMSNEPRNNTKWTHPIVYHAGRLTGWYLLVHSAESRSFPLFEQQYNKLCDEVAAGTKLAMPTATELPPRVQATASPQEQKQRLQALRDNLGL